MNRRYLLSHLFCFAGNQMVAGVACSADEPLGAQNFRDDPQLKLLGFINKCADYERVISHAQFLRQRIRTDDVYLKRVMADHQKRLSKLRKSIGQVPSKNVDLVAQQIVNKIEFIAAVALDTVSFLAVLCAFEIAAVPAALLAAGGLVIGITIDLSRLIYEDDPLSPTFIIVYDSLEARIIPEIDSMLPLFSRALNVFNIVKSLKEIGSAQESLTQLTLKLIAMKQEAKAIEALLSRYPAGNLPAWRGLIDAELTGTIDSLGKFVSKNRKYNCISFPESGGQINPKI
jgi:hypothetical protein